MTTYTDLELMYDGKIPAAALAQLTVVPANMDQTDTEYALAQARKNLLAELAQINKAFEGAKKDLGAANRIKSGSKKYWQGQALRRLNTLRARRNRAIKAWAELAH